MRAPSYVDTSSGLFLERILGVYDVNLGPNPNARVIPEPTMRG